MQKIITNKIKCNKCGDIVESKTFNDLRWCHCGTVAAEGGNIFLRRRGNVEDYEELSECIEE